MKDILVTGAAGFIGFHVAGRLLERGDRVVGIDNLSEYYDVRLKRDRLAQLLEKPGFRFRRMDLANRDAVSEMFQADAFHTVIHLAAQAGVRYSLENPHACVDANLVGFVNILEGCRHTQVKHLVYASSSSVYGASRKIPFSVTDNVDHPVSLYAATKKANELMAHTYSCLYGLPTTGLRFFTVYGPWGRPDMAYFKFTKAMLEDRPIDVYNHGNMQRDFTYIDDIVEGVVRVADRVPRPPAETPYRLYNIGNHRSEPLTRVIEILEELLGRKAQQNLPPMQPGDVFVTYADVDDLIRDTGFSPNTPLEEGLAAFVDWFRAYYPDCE